MQHLKEYQGNIDHLKQNSLKLTASDRRISTVRLLVIIAAVILIYKGLYDKESFFLLLAGIVMVAFVLVVKQHTKIRWQKRLADELVKVNQDEIAFLKDGINPFDPGEKYIDSHHPYSFDLDFFGPRSLFQHLNRTGTVLGKEILAKSLLQIESKEKIEQTQAAIQELAPIVSWRQQLLALAHVQQDSDESLADLLDWTRKEPIQIGKFTKVLSFAVPALTISCFIIYFATPYEVFWRLGLLGFLINLGILASYSLSIKNELISTTRIEKILGQYAHIFKMIEGSNFTSSELRSLKSRLVRHQSKASSAIHDLSLLFGRMEHVANVFASPILNGLLLYHLHVIKGLSTWRMKHATAVEDWLAVIGTFERLNSLANFSYNNPDFVFPTINNDSQIQFEDLGHPLIPKDKNVTNSMNFDEQPFFILTGSNMSGKSTFLRTLGVNMVLASIGAPVFASRASIHPLPVIVSMRLSDSLSDSESYFYAEVKRLKFIMEQLQQSACFVLLDEILRGTNSDDKRNGTIDVIRKMANFQAFGGIATHDLEVCKIVDEYPKRLSNKRFEVEIIDDELVFDYKLREGICQNKSASFIMKKMGVI